MDWVTYLPDEGDPPALHQAKRRFLAWMGLNTCILLGPLVLRTGILLFGDPGDGFRLFRLEEPFLYSLFVTASALTDIWVHSSQPKPRFSLRLTGAGVVLAGLGALHILVYGVAFAEPGRIDVQQRIGLSVLICAGLVFSFLTEKFVIDEIFLREATQET